MISKDNFLFYDTSSIGILQNFKLKRVIKNLLGFNDNILMIQRISKTLIAVGSANKILIYSLNNNKII